MHAFLQFVAYSFAGAVALAFFFATIGVLALPKGQRRSRTWMAAFLLAMAGWMAAFALAVAVLVAVTKEGVEKLAWTCRKFADRIARLVTGRSDSGEALSASV